MIYKSYIIEQDLNALKKKIILFYGENIGLKRDFKTKLKNKNREFKFFTFHQDEILKNNNLLFNEISTKSLFENGKIFFIENCNDKILDNLKELEEKNIDLEIYLFADILEKKSKLRNYFEKSQNCAAVACYPDNELNIKKIITSRLSGFSGLSTQNINLIMNNCNLDRIKLSNEIEKIIIFFQNKKIDTEKLRILLNDRINEDFAKLKDEALMGNKQNTNKLLSDTIIDEEKNIYYLNLINQRLHRLLEIKNNSKVSNIEEVIENTKPPIFWKDKQNFIKQAKSLSIENIEFILNQTYKLEKNIKSNSSLNKKLLIKKLLVDVCALSSS